MTPHRETCNRRSGFSLLEVVSIMAISIIVATTALSTINRTGTFSLRSSVTSLEQLLRDCRMLAMKRTEIMSTHFVVTAGKSNGVLAYVKQAADPNPLSTGNSPEQLEEPITRVASPSGTEAPRSLESTFLGFTPESGDPSFTPTGLPCVYSNGNCANSGFIYYFHDLHPRQNAWAAISISPSGRLKTWYWNGTEWTK